MTKTQEKSIPALRFPEFSGDWKANGLGEVAKIERGRFSPRPRNDPKYYGGDIPFVQTSEVVNAKGRIRKYSQTLNEKGLAVSKIFPKGSLLITIAANIGFAGVLEKDMACPDSLIGLTCTKALNNYFLNYILEISQPKMDYLAVEAAQKNINIEFLKPYKICFPTITEQHKIASFLSSVDTKIEQLGKKITLLEEYKKGMMQKLFSQEIRFKDEQGNEYPDWEELELSDLYKFIPTNSYSREKLNYDHGLVSNIHYGDIHTKFRARFNLVEEYVPLINTDVNLDKVTQDKYCQAGDLVIADASEDYVDIGKTIELLNLNGEKVLAGLHTLLARLASEDIYIGYGSYMMACEPIRKQIMRIAQGTKVLSISTGRMNKVKLPIPPKKEQQKIANFLSAIDNKIELVGTELELAQTFKKGLLQQMFI